MLLVIVVLSFAASALVRFWMMRTYAKWGSHPNTVGANGHDVARLILNSHDLHNVRLEESKGKLSDHYVPSQKLIRLSESINREPSVAAIAVAAHEVGHAIQDKEQYGPLKFKAAMMPMAAMGNQFGLILAMAGGIIGIPALLNVGMIMIGLGVVMPVLTLPIEFDASAKALRELQKHNLVNETDYAGAKSMLTAAALTYVASAASSMAIMGIFLLRMFRR